MHGKLLAIIPIISEVGREVTGVVNTVVGTDLGKIVRKWLTVG